MTRIAIILSAVAASLFSQPTLAADSGGYVGIGLADAFLSACNNTTATCANFNDSPAGAHPRLVGGYDFNKYIGVEAGLAGLGTFTVRDTLGATNIGTAKASALTLAAKGGYKFNFGLSLFGKLGLANVWAKYSGYPGSALPASISQRSTGVIVGLGAQYDFNNGIGIRMSTDVITFSDSYYKGGFVATNILAIFKF